MPGTRICIYCDKRMKAGYRGDHVFPVSLGGGLALLDRTDYQVCSDCNGGVLGQLDDELAPPTRACAAGLSPSPKRILSAHAGRILFATSRSCKQFCQRSLSNQRVSRAASRLETCLSRPLYSLCITTGSRRSSRRHNRKRHFFRSRWNARACKPLCARFRRQSDQVPGQTPAWKLSSPTLSRWAAAAAHSPWESRKRQKKADLQGPQSAKKWESDPKGGRKGRKGRKRQKKAELKGSKKGRKRRPGRFFREVSLM
jgi:hypothetical protein